MKELVEHIKHQIAWSMRTFGPGDRTEGVCNHIREELTEIIESAGRDLTEWCDVIILAIDGAWRSGATAEEIVDALLTANPTRTAAATAARLYEIRGALDAPRICGRAGAPKLGGDCCGRGSGRVGGRLHAARDHRRDRGEAGEERGPPLAGLAGGRFQQADQARSRGLIP